MEKRSAKLVRANSQRYVNKILELALAQKLSSSEVALEDRTGPTWNSLPQYCS